MPKLIIKNDIYDKNGILLISKGQIITNKTIAKLRKHLDGKIDLSISLEDIEGEGHESISKGFGERKKITNYHILEKPSKILSSIIFNSKTEPWWIYINTLCNHIASLYTHSIDVGMISLIIADELGYNDDELYNIGLGALLHDVGMLLVPRFILQRQRNLNEVEESFLRQHCELGVSSLEKFNLPQVINDIAMQHHERMDGSGYPMGLKANEINESAQMIMIADELDMLTTYSPYRELYDLTTAIDKLKNENHKFPQNIIGSIEQLLY